MDNSNFAIERRQREQRKEDEILFDALSNLPIDTLFLIIDVCSKVAMLPVSHMKFERLSNMISVVLSEKEREALEIQNKIKGGCCAS